MLGKGEQGCWGDYDIARNKAKRGRGKTERFARSRCGWMQL